MKLLNAHFKRMLFWGGTEQHAQSYLLPSMRPESERGKTPSRTERRERRKVPVDEVVWNVLADEVPPQEEDGAKETSNEHLQ